MLTTTKNHVNGTGPQLPAWMIAMRQAAQEAVSSEDIAAIVKTQVDKAKAGDPAAVKFVFEQVLGGAAFKGATIVQNNYGGGDESGPPPRVPPTHAPPRNPFK